MGRPDDLCTYCLQRGHRASHCPRRSFRCNSFGNRLTGDIDLRDTAFTATHPSKEPLMTYETAAEVLATLPGLRARLRKARKLVKATALAGEGAHVQIAARRISDAALFAERNTAHAVRCCWEARHHLNHVVGA